ncbi:MAG: isoprenylcysteine carboxylmethyltransferase family protein [Bdellovibrio sp.]|nr:isoprenylcysteine carboxylmethyltransferase family protein [Bdellovibrio sp.]
MELTHSYRGIIRGKTRILLAWIFAIVLILSSRKYPPDWLGIFLCFNGATLRFWASGYLYKDSNLALGGPYAYLRNPLFLGTYLMAIGITVATGNILLFLITTIIFGLIYYYIILDEEEKLKQIFGQTYELYCRAVPRFFPRLWPPNKELFMQINPELERRKFSWHLAWKNKAYEAYLSFVVLCAAISIIGYFFSKI